MFSVRCSLDGVSTELFRVVCRGFDNPLALLFEFIEEFEEAFGVGEFEVVEVVLELEVVVDVFIGDSIAPFEVFPKGHSSIDHEAEAFGPIGYFDGDGIKFDSSHLLEEGELCDFGSVEPDFPSDSAGSHARRFPVVFDKSDVVFLDVESDGVEASEVAVYDVVRAWLHDDLVLIVALVSHGVTAVSSVCGSSAGLDIGTVPGVRAEAFDYGRGVHGAGTDFDVVWLQDDATL